MVPQSTKQGEHEMAYAIKQSYNDGDVTYLNHSCLSSLSFGSADMAWHTSNRNKAYNMLKRVVEHKSIATSVFQVVTIEDDPDFFAE